jgi:hypothetical protein
MLALTHVPQGWLTAGGSLARMVGPVFGVLAWNRGKASPVAFGTAAVVGTSIIVLAVCWRWLVAHPEVMNARLSRSLLTLLLAVRGNHQPGPT